MYDYIAPYMVIHNNNKHEHKHKREHNNTEEGEEVVPVEERTKKDDEQLKLNDPDYITTRIDK